MDLPPLPLDRDDERPLAAQLADALRAATAGGAFRAGDRLPSTRALATTLQVSRTVTAAAYDQLLAEGWAVGRRGAGTFVVGTPAGTRAAAPGPFTPSPRRAPAEITLFAGTPCVEVLDGAAWRRAWRAAADDPPDVEPEPIGLPAFRSAVVEHLLRHRGLAAGPDDVLATGGSTGAVAELARTLPPGARVAVEEPGYQRAVAALRAAGLVVVPVPVDASGLVVDALPAGLAAVYVTPAHQYPMGARLPAARRVALVDRARAEGFLVIEDDYDGELRYDVAPLPLLAALGPDVVVHLGTASKLLTPTLGAGWMVAPPAVRAAVLDLRDRTGTRPARAGQRVFAAFAAHGDLARHLRRLRRELASRRAAVAAAVTDAVVGNTEMRNTEMRGAEVWGAEVWGAGGGDAIAGAAVVGDQAGAHVVVPLPDAAAERAVIAAAARRGVALDGLARHHLGEPGVHGILLGYAGPSRADLDRALPVVTAALMSMPR